MNISVHTTSGLKSHVPSWIMSLLCFWKIILSIHLLETAKVRNFKFLVLQLFANEIKVLDFCIILDFKEILVPYQVSVMTRYRQKWEFGFIARDYLIFLNWVCFEQNKSISAIMNEYPSKNVSSLHFIGSRITLLKSGKPLLITLTVKIDKISFCVSIYWNS